MKEHDLKIWPEFFEAVVDGRKTFELRKDDRMGFEVGDRLILNEWKPMVFDGVVQTQLGTYTGRKVVVRVTYVLSDSPVLRPKYVAMGIERTEAKQ